VKTASRQVVTHIRESRRFKSIYTVRGKLDQHDTCISHSVRVWSQTIRISRGQHIATFRIVINKVEQGHCSRGKRAPDTFHSTPADRSAGPYPISLLSQPLKQWGQSQPSVDGRLLGLPGSYHWYAIGTFNTCSRWSTNRSLTDTGGGYKPWRCRFSTHHSSTFLTDGPLLST
jgi:hypothetical protein